MKNRTLQLWSGQRLHAACLAAASAVVLVLGGCGGGSSTDAAAVPEPTTIIEANLDTQAAQIGGATQDATYYEDLSGTKWALYSMANRFAATKIGMSQDTVSEITVPGYIQHITQINYGGKPYALLSMGGKGIGVVDISNPAAMTYVRTMTVAYSHGGVTYVDGGGTLVADATISGASGPVNDLLVYMDTNDDDQLLIANTAFGIQQTKLSNLMDAAADGELTIDGPQEWTLQYAGENPWGGPLSLKMHTDPATGKDKLYAALGFLGIGIYDPATLAREAGYNLYTDTTTREDWFGYQHQKPSDPGVLNVAGALDPVTGMPTYEEAGFELKNKSTVTSYPWAAFDRYGKYYYNARTLDLVDIPAIPASGGNPALPARTMAYIAYSLGGLVAVDVTNSDTTKPSYIGYVPAAPAHGPDEPTGQQAKSILSHFGSGMLKEAGVMDVRVVPDATGTGYKAYYSDHFAGLVVVSGVEDPKAKWKNGSGGFNNDTQPEAFWPDYEFVTSFDMTPVPVGDESMPKFLTVDPATGKYTAPVLLVTGEISGHGGALFMMPAATRDTGAAGQVDLVQSSGGGGVNFVDIKDVTTSSVAVAERFAVPVHLVSTNEVGADENGAAAPGSIAIGHAEGLAVSGNYVYLADGPHGMSAWRVADGAGVPTDDLHLVANTLQSEYPTGNGILPAPHAFSVAFDADPTKAYVLTQSLGLRRVDVSAVTGGSAQVGSPALLNVLASGIYEHSSESGGNLGGIHGQDHAYGVTFYGKYAIVADGGNGLTVYDTTVDATTGTQVVANIGSETGKPQLGRSQSVKLWTDAATGKVYAVAAAGPYGISVVDMTGLLVQGNTTNGMTLLKTFEPIKIEEDKVGSADGKSVDVQIVGGYAYISYDSFGLVAYKMTDLIQPLASFKPECAAVDPAKVFDKQGGVDCRPVAVGHFKLQEQAGYETLDGGAQFMTPQYFPANQLLRNGAGTVYTLDQPRVLFYVAYAEAGVVKLDWSDPANPKLMAIKDTVGSAAATAIANGRVYVADGTGGMVVFK